MKKTNRQLVVGSLQPFFFCVGMYLVVLIFSVFVCTSIYRAFNGNKSIVAMQKNNQPQQDLKQVTTAGTAAMVTAIK
jgi:uncharacterized membrane protein